MFSDVPADRLPHKVLHGLALPHKPPDLGRGNVNQRCPHHAPPQPLDLSRSEAAGKRGEYLLEPLVPRRSGGHQDIGQLQNLTRAAPVRQVRQHVRPDKPGKLHILTCIASQGGQRVDSVAGPVAGKLQLADSEEVIPSDCQSQHGQAMLSRCVGRLLVRRPGGWNKCHALERTLLGDCSRNGQVPVVNGVKRPAEQYDALGHAWI